MNKPYETPPRFRDKPIGAQENERIFLCAVCGWERWLVRSPIKQQNIYTHQVYGDGTVLSHAERDIRFHNHWRQKIAVGHASGARKAQMPGRSRVRTRAGTVVGFSG